jgi:hypothetical protein
MDIENRDDVDSIVRYRNIKILFARNAMPCECVRVPAGLDRRALRGDCAAHLSMRELSSVNVDIVTNQELRIRMREYFGRHERSKGMHLLHYIDRRSRH